MIYLHPCRAVIALQARTRESRSMSRSNRHHSAAMETPVGSRTQAVCRTPPMHRMRDDTARGLPVGSWAENCSAAGPGAGQTPGRRLRNTGRRGVTFHRLRSFSDPIDPSVLRRGAPSGVGVSIPRPL